MLSHLQHQWKFFIKTLILPFL